jgi:hydroxyacylglutathione hydrolase
MPWAFTVSAVLHTHAHFDHFLASGHIKRPGRLYTYIPKTEIFGKCWKFNAECLTLRMCLLFFRTGQSAMGQDLEIGSYIGIVIHTPENTLPGRYVFISKAKEWCWPGRTSFEEERGRTDLWGGDENRYVDLSIRERLFTLKENTLIITGHGPESSIGCGREFNMLSM